MKYRYVVRFAGGLGDAAYINVACNDWAEVEREVATFGIDNLIYIRENL